MCVIFYTALKMFSKKYRNRKILSQNASLLCQAFVLSLLMTKTTNGHSIPIRPLRILYWNCDGIERDKLLFDYILQQQQIDIALLCETKLKQNTNWKIRNYYIYNTPGPNPTHGGTAVIVKACIPHYQLQLPQFSNLQLTAIKIPTDRKSVV